MAFNCGECPNSTTTNMITCSGDYAQLTSDHPCSFAVGTAVCNGTAVDVSITVTVDVHVPGPTMAGMYS
jgi:hypothetical protein